MDTKDMPPNEAMSPGAKEMMQHAQSTMQESRDMMQQVRMYHMVSYAFDGLFLIGLVAVVVLLSKVLGELRKK